MTSISKVRDPETGRYREPYPHELSPAQRARDPHARERRQIRPNGLHGPRRHSRDEERQR